MAHLGGLVLLFFLGGGTPTQGTEGLRAELRQFSEDNSKPQMVALVPLQDSGETHNRALDSRDSVQSGKRSSAASPTPNRFYPADLLTARPRFLSAPVLDFGEALRGDISGEVVLQLTISDEGLVLGVEVLVSQLPDAINRAIVKAFYGVGFSPGEMNGRRVGSLIEVQFQYGVSSHEGE